MKGLSWWFLWRNTWNTYKKMFKLLPAVSCDFTSHTKVCHLLLRLWLKKCHYLCLIQFCTWIHVPNILCLCCIKRCEHKIHHYSGGYQGLIKSMLRWELSSICLHPTVFFYYFNQPWHITRFSLIKFLCLFPTKYNDTFDFFIYLQNENFDLKCGIIDA